MVESAEDRSNRDLAMPVSKRPRRRLQGEAAMRAIAVVVVNELLQDRAQVEFAERYQVVEGTRGGQSSPSARRSRWPVVPESASERSRCQVRRCAG